MRVFFKTESLNAKTTYFKFCEKTLVKTQNRQQIEKFSMISVVERSAAYFLNYKYYNYVVNITSVWFHVTHANVLRMIL